MMPVAVFIANMFGYTHAMEQATPGKTKFDSLLKLEGLLSTAVVNIRADQAMVDSAHFSKKNKFKLGEIVLIPRSGGYYTTGVFVGAAPQRDAAWIQTETSGKKVSRKYIGQLPGRPNISVK